MIKLLFFARLREDLNADEETLSLPSHVTSVSALRDLLCERGDAWHTALNMQGLFIAVNQKVVAWDTPINGDEEIAFFPPVTGG